MNTAQGMTGAASIGRGAFSARPILLIESDFQYSVAISRVFRDLNLLDTLVISVDCENALTRLRQGNGPDPCLILLDLEMPRMSAFDFLKAVKSDERLRMVPVVVLAAASNAQEVTRCYGLGAAGYMVRPTAYAELHDKMAAICSYWSLSCLPGSQ